MSARWAKRKVPVPCESLRALLNRLVMHFVFTVVLILFLAGRAWALSYATAESSMVGRMTMYLKLYQAEYGVLPTQWSDLEKIAGKPLDKGFVTGSPAKRYAFIPGVEMLGPEEGRIIVMMMKPSYETTLSTGFFGLDRSVKGPGRYIIYRTPEGDFRYRWMVAREIVRTFKEGKQALPTPDNEPEPGSVASARGEMYFQRGVYTLVVLGVAGGLFWKLMRRPRAS